MVHVRLSFACLLVSIPLVAFAQQTSQTKSDRDKDELRGPVKTVIEEDTFSFRAGPPVITTTTNYALDGRILEERTKNPDGSECVTSYTYHPDGRLLKTVASAVGKSTDSSVAIYSYDNALRLTEVKSTQGEKSSVKRYQYDDKGRKSVIETLDKPHAIYPWECHPSMGRNRPWKGTELGFLFITAGTVTTSYNEQGVATGAEYHDPEGKLVGHIERKFDSEGHVIAEEQAADGPPPVVGLLRVGAEDRTYSYSYDEHGRVTERRRSGGMTGEVTITEYNDHGDKALERTTLMRAFIPSGKPNPPRPPMMSETQYTYQYDQYGNWTEQTIAGSALRAPDEAFQPGTVIRRNLTYY
jgi:YD repeat-containing protein